MSVWFSWLPSHITHELDSLLSIISSKWKTFEPVNLFKKEKIATLFKKLQKFKVATGILRTFKRLKLAIFYLKKLKRSVLSQGVARLFALHSPFLALYFAPDPRTTPPPLSSSFLIFIYGCYFQNAGCCARASTPFGVKAFLFVLLFIAVCF